MAVSTAGIESSTDGGFIQYRKLLGQVSEQVLAFWQVGGWFRALNCGFQSRPLAAVGLNHLHRKGVCQAESHGIHSALLGPVGEKCGV